jgi:branched-chain amino acid transport system permease protein
VGVVAPTCERRTYMLANDGDAFEGETNERPRVHRAHQLVGTAAMIFFQYLANGIANGALYSLVSLGFVVIFKASTSVNFAQGAFMVLAAYLATTALSGGLPFGVVVVLLPLAMAALGFFAYNLLLRRLTGQGFFSVVLVTVGMEILIRAGVLVWYGPNPRGRARSLPAGQMKLGDVTIPYVNVIVVAAALTVSVGFLVFFKRARLGLFMRGTAENLEAATAMGVSPSRIYGVAWAIGLGMAGFAGVLYTNYASSIDLGATSIGLRAFPAAILGGIDSAGGAVVGGITLGVLESVVAGYLGAEYRDAAAFGVMLIVILVRPAGFFGTKELVRV